MLLLYVTGYTLHIYVLFIAGYAWMSYIYIASERYIIISPVVIED